MAAVTPEIIEAVAKAVQGTTFGAITLIVQDARLIQMDKLEKVRFVAQAHCSGKEGLSKPIPADKIKNKVQTALKGMEYGQVLLAVRDGAIVQIERTEKQRLKYLQGVDGEGI